MLNENEIKTVEGNIIGTSLKIGIVVSRFNEMITSKLLDGCIDGLIRHGVIREDITLYRVPGAFEIPGIAKLVCDKAEVDAVICLGAVIRGDTPHFDYVANEVSKGIAHISLSSKIPVIYGIITADNVEQALDRAGIKTGNKGFDAAVTAIETVNVVKKLIK